MLLLAILGVDPAQNLEKYKRWLSVNTTNQQKYCDYVISCNSCIVNEDKTKDVQGQGPSNINPSLFVCCFDVYRLVLTISSINYVVNQ